MFTGFNLTVDNSLFKDEFERYKKIGEKNFENNKNKIEKNLKDYIQNGIIDGAKLQESWFPKIKADIFISHSHKDKDLAIALSGWLSEKFKLNCFIDSCVWGYINDLLSQINDKYSNKRQGDDGGILYSHEKCNIASTHVNMMLNIALQNMIDNTEAVFLINTSNSIDKYDGQASTFSPWIYSEIITTTLIRKKKLSEYRKTNTLKKHEFSESQEDFKLKVKYEVTLSHLNELTYENLVSWESEYQRKKDNNYTVNFYPLDDLYRIKKYIK